MEGILIVPVETPPMRIFFIIIICIRWFCLAENEEQIDVSVAGMQSNLCYLMFVQNKQLVTVVASRTGQLTSHYSPKKIPSLIGNSSS